MCFIRQLCFFKFIGVKIVPASFGKLFVKILQRFRRAAKPFPDPENHFTGGRGQCGKLKNVSSGGEAIIGF